MGKEIEKAIQNNNLRLRLINEQTIDFMGTRVRYFKKVQKDIVPKGKLKKWALNLELFTSISANGIY